MSKTEVVKTLNTKLKELFANRNLHSVPKVTKVVLNYRVKEARENQEALNQAIEELASIAGQKPSVTRAKKAISSFKLRQKDPVAIKVTLRGEKMYDFLEKFLNLVLPRLRDFKGISPESFDGRGNYNMTIKDQTYFPEIDLNKVNKIRSLQITIGTSATTNADAKMLLSALGAKFLN